MTRFPLINLFQDLVLLRLNCHSRLLNLVNLLLRPCSIVERVDHFLVELWGLVLHILEVVNLPIELHCYFMISAFEYTVFCLFGFAFYSGFYLWNHFTNLLRRQADVIHFRVERASRFLCSAFFVSADVAA
jgi:hypothetical protein